MVKLIRSGVATLIMSSMALGAVIAPAKADTTSTVLITAAAVAALMTGINVAEKNAKANQLVGYLPNGSPVYADGHVVARNGQVWYPGNQGQSISCNGGGQCIIVAGTGSGVYTGYGYPGYNGGYPGYNGGYPGYGGGYPGYGAYPSNYGGGYYPANTGGYYPATTTTVNRYVDRTYKTIYVRHDNGKHRGWDKNRDRNQNDDDDGDGPGH